MAARPKKAQKSVAQRSSKKTTAAKKPTGKKTAAVPKDKLLSRLTIFFFDRPLITAVLWILLTLFGAFSYASLLRREGFPSINIPLTIVTGTYFVNDASKVDSDAAGPISEIALEQEGVSSVQTQSLANFFTVSVIYEEGVDAQKAADSIENTVKESGRLPADVMAKYNVPYFGATGGDAQKIDLAVSFFAYEDKETKDIVAKAEEAAAWLKERRIENVEDVFVKNPFEQRFDPASQQAVTLQRSFDRFGRRENESNNYRTSVIIGIAGGGDFDIIKLDEAVDKELEALKTEGRFEGYGAEISASFAPTIKENISELQRSLIEGLIAVLIVGSIVIALRASLITVISMITVVAITLGLLYGIGYTLNVITLFSLILALALIVDDTIIMVEAIDAARHHHKDRRKAVSEATRKVSRAMVAATATASLSFAPLLFVSGILGTFIRAIPITIISALIISLFVALLFIPFFARFLLLGPKQMGKKGVVEVAAGFEEKIARTVTRPMVWARKSRRKLFAVGSAAVFIGLGFILAGLWIARSVPFNIFPPTKDSNGLVANISLAPGLSIEQAEAKVSEIDKLIGEHLGENFIQASYFGTGSAQGGDQRIEIISYGKREPTSRQLAEELQEKLNKEISGAAVAVGQVDVGPPASNFTVQVEAQDREAAFAAANDLKEFLEAKELKRPDDTVARFENVNLSSPAQFIRNNGIPVVTVTAGFDGDDTSTLVSLGQTAVSDEFDSVKLASYNLANDAISFDIGQESENQESFKALALAFPVLLAVMYTLLAVQFRSLLQPLLIFMAIPFSLFGITLGLDISNNAFSFFAMLGFFALVGLSVKNTILLTDYANQARRAGMGVVDSAVEALKERFRPLFATSATAVVSLIPLALTSPFWEGLTVVLIFGLLSSTLLVVTVFPYYYLGAEYLRQKISYKQFLVWLIVTLVAMVIVGRLVSPVWGLLILPISLATAALQGFYARKLS